MPLVGYHLIGFDKGPLSFDEANLKLVGSERSRERTHAFFEHCPHKFNLVFYNGDWRQEDPLYKKYRRAMNADFHWLLHGRVGKPFKPKGRDWSLPIPHDPNAINVVLTSNATGKIIPIPLTPWMIAHRMAHIQVLAMDDISILTHTLEWGYHILKYTYGYELLRQPSVMDWNERLRPQPKKGGIKPHADARVFHGLFINMSTSRACRTGQMLPWFEYFPEWWVQYIKFGVIRLTPTLPDRLDLTRMIDDPKGLMTPFPERELTTNKIVSTDQFANFMGRKYEGVLREWTGGVIVT